MVAGYHLIWTGYGWWLLANDPRGSTSREIRVPAIADLVRCTMAANAYSPPAE